MIHMNIMQSSLQEKFKNIQSDIKQNIQDTPSLPTDEDDSNFSNEFRQLPQKISTEFKRSSSPNQHYKHDQNLSQNNSDKSIKQKQTDKQNLLDINEQNQRNQNDNIYQSFTTFQGESSLHANSKNTRNNKIQRKKTNALMFTPEEMIYQAGKQDDFSVYFIQKGMVEFFLQSKYQKNDKKIKSLKIINAGQSFGEISFFTGLPREVSIRSIDFTTVLKVQRKDFIELLQNFNEDYEQFCEIKDQIIFAKDFSQLSSHCISCANKYHQIGECPFIRYNPQNDLIVKKYIYNPGQIERQIFSRKQKSTNAISDQQNIEIQIEKFQEENYVLINEIIEQYEQNDDGTDEQDDSSLEDSFSLTSQSPLAEEYKQINSQQKYFRNQQFLSHQCLITYQFIRQDELSNFFSHIKKLAKNNSVQNVQTSDNDSDFKSATSISRPTNKGDTGKHIFIDKTGRQS
ncbi:Cyclic nucleotide-binding protein [Pseudocohnilembus persalinus]|uniref:Cyclic nucleotide-binding protein n=1 Tax=Pseudocohnilembus persalinus TaxID=266149 RepID=A0A0V0QB95_PSEPJ|nr:Cyclic nucleotide-binding protein [Pseudocohnilembus persalinus]|eukprot:KRW99497.1 Cyclic nucleotide-binding protein [Pseudocohnilembus persalinus]